MGPMRRDRLRVPVAKETGLLRPPPHPSVRGNADAFFTCSRPFNHCPQNLTEQPSDMLCARRIDKLALAVVREVPPRLSTKGDLKCP
jgi:hypothetical protein